MHCPTYNLFKKHVLLINFINLLYTIISNTHYITITVFFNGPHFECRPPRTFWNVWRTHDVNRPTVRAGGYYRWLNLSCCDYFSIILHIRMYCISHWNGWKQEKLILMISLRNPRSQTVCHCSTGFTRFTETTCASHFIQITLSAVQSLQ